MSWTGILRPGDEFPPALRSRLANLTATSGPSLQRRYGAWSARYRRFTLTLNSPRIRAEVVEPDEPMPQGVSCLLHWVREADMVRTDRGGVCSGDGWPVELWESFTSGLDALPPGTVSDKLAAFATSSREPDKPIVAAWRAVVQGEPVPGPEGASVLGRGWIPVPVPLATPTGKRTCIVSWAPAARTFGSLHEALASPEARRFPVDLESQARYHLECTLGKLHGVVFGPGDAVEDPQYEQRTEVRALSRSLLAWERAQLDDPARGRLDRLG